MVDLQRQSDLEMLARMAAELAGCDPDRRILVQIGDTVATHLAWRYPEFLDRAEAAYAVLVAGTVPLG